MELKKNELYHWGILGQKWGVRRFQNPDGSLTDEGRKRYLKLYSKKPDNIKNQQLIKTSAKEMYQLYEKELANKRIFERFDEQDKQYDKIKSKIYSTVTDKQIDKFKQKMISRHEDDINNAIDYFNIQYNEKNIDRDQYLKELNELNQSKKNYPDKVKSFSKQFIIDNTEFLYNESKNNKKIDSLRKELRNITSKQYDLYKEYTQIFVDTYKNYYGEDLYNSNKYKNGYSFIKYMFDTKDSKAYKNYYDFMSIALDDGEIRDLKEFSENKKYDF